MVEKNLKRVKGDRYYGATAKKYEEIRTKQDWWAVEQKEMQYLLDKLPRDLSVVDIPFGTGRFVPYYIERGYKISGLDASDAMLAQAKEILGDQMDGVEVKRGFSTDLPYDDNQFDLLVSTRFLRDIITFKDAKLSLKEFARVTKSYAILQIGVRIEEPFEVPDEDEKMSSRLSYDQNVELLKEYGFKVVDSRFVKGTRDKQSEIRHFLVERI